MSEYASSPQRYGGAVRKDFMERPENGWLHDGRGLVAGKGVYFSFPVFYMGSIHMPVSISSIPKDNQTDVTREAIAKVHDAVSGKSESNNRELSHAAMSYQFGRVNEAKVQVKLSISASGMIVAPVNSDIPGIDPGIIHFHPMRLISLASGGEGDHYDFVSYVAKDKDSNLRECFVFDTGVFSDEVLSTMGQAFILAQQMGQSSGGHNPHEDPTYASLDEALRMPPGADAIYQEAQDVLKKQIYRDVKPNPPGSDVEYRPSYLDVVPRNPGEYLDVTAGLQEMGMGESIYDLADVQVAEDFVRKLNENDTYLTTEVSKKLMMQREVDQSNSEYMLLAPDLSTKPTWDAYKVEEVRNKVPLDKYKEAQQTYMDVCPRPLPK
eukprot:m.10802 g.10802  ORF g.10802 m.10802 type:complete len:380 (+) comp4320_c0_seq2:165-1304(+)